MLLGGLAIAFWLRGALDNHWVRFPREKAAWQGLRAQRQAVPELPAWTEYRGLLHSHSHVSHDCELPFEEILHTLQSAHLDFICLSDHCVDGRADFSAQWRGLHDGILFVPGLKSKCLLVLVTVQN